MYLDYFVFVSVSTAAIKSMLNGWLTEELAKIYIVGAIIGLGIIRLTRLPLLAKNPVGSSLFGLANFAWAFSDGNVRESLIVAALVSGVALGLFGVYYMFVGSVRASMGYSDFEGTRHDGGSKMTLGTAIFLLVLILAAISVALDWYKVHL